MATPAKAFELPSKLPKDKEEPQTTTAPQEKKDSNVTYLNREYDAYHTLEGSLSLPEYEIVEKIVEEKRGSPVKKAYLASAKGYAGVDNKLSDEVLRLYAILRDYYNTPAIPDKLAKMSDPELLAEVLRMRGEETALKKLKNSEIFKKGTATMPAPPKV